jgi:hypothetical protein
MLSCRAEKTVVEPGAVLLRVKTPVGAPAPDELRAWVYDDGGRLWDGVRIPAEGALAGGHGQDLGTILVQPGTFRGKLRVHLRAFATGVRILDGSVTIASLAGEARTVDVLLDPAPPADADGDDVPDGIDDCPAIPNPAQGGCAASPAPDAGPDAVADGQAEEALVETPDAPGAEAVPADAPPDRSGVEGLPADEGGAPDDAPGAEADAGAAEADADAAGADPDAAGLIVVDASDLDVAEIDAGVEGGTAGDGGVDGAGENRPQGALCTESAQCASGFCADGVCCTNACLGPCRSCNQPSATGICQGYPSGLDPELECTGGATCNGVGACGGGFASGLGNGQLCAAGGQCASGFCTDGVCCDSACTSPCQACGSGVCLTVKKTDDVPQCTGGQTCNPRGSCVAR